MNYVSHSFIAHCLQYIDNIKRFFFRRQIRLQFNYLALEQLLPGVGAHVLRVVLLREEVLAAVLALVGLDLEVDALAVVDESTVGLEGRSSS